VINGWAYREQVLGPLNNAWPCGCIGGERASIGTGEGASLSKALESFVDRLNKMGPGEVGRFGGMSEGVHHTVQDDPANTVGEH